jgi:tRNA (adenine58-N1)-methyltransferase non-catalytic subunit
VIESAPTTTTTGDNRSFTDTNTAQKLTDLEIHQLKDQGASANDIIASLISNSETWNNKSGFSQEKWLMKKQKK